MTQLKRTIHHLFSLQVMAKDENALLNPSWLKAFPFVSLISPGQITTHEKCDNGE